ncbi:hypothetical protein FRB91_004650 [Serendipita sp. 411]|nr:hypothetical protein FRB91_004650 [Serendipita sp. 411]
MGVSHIGITVEDGSLDKMVEWYLTVLAPLGYKKMYDLRPAVQSVGLGQMFPDFWIQTAPGYKHPPEERQHIAFYSGSRQKIRDFHALAMRVGSKDNGGPGLRPEYTATYYAAYVFDPEGRNIEVHSMGPGFWAEPKPRSVILSALGVAVAVGMSYFANVGGYLGSWAL